MIEEGNLGVDIARIGGVKYPIGRGLREKVYRGLGVGVEERLKHRERIVAGAAEKSEGSRVGEDGEARKVSESSVSGDRAGFRKVKVL